MQDDEQRLDAAEKPELVADKLSPEAEQPPEPPEEEDDFTPSRALLDQIRDAIDDEDPAKLNELLEPMHAADIADVIENLRRRGGASSCRSGPERSTATSCRRSTN